MRRATPALVALALVAASASAQPGPPAPLPPGVTRTLITPAPLFQTLALACDGEHAYVRDGRGRVIRWDGSAWLEHAPAAADHAWGHRLWISPAGEVVVDAGDALARWDGRAWQPVAVDPWFRSGGRRLEIDAISGLGSPWVLGRGAIGVAIDGTVRPFDLGDAWYALHDLAVLAPDHVLVASAAGLSRWDGRAWSPVATGLGGAAYELLVRAPDDVWVLGEEGVARWDGRAWSTLNEGLDVARLPRPRRSTVPPHIGGAAPDHVYLTTPDRVLRWAGSRWEPFLDSTQRSGFGRGYGEVCATERQVVIEEGGHALVIARR